jgi:hypothetical protein
MTNAGIAQSVERGQHRPLAEVAGAEPAPRSTPAQAFAQGLRLDPISWAAGHDAGRRGETWRGMDHPDPLAHASGYVEGQVQRGCCNGECAQSGEAT